MLKWKLTFFSSSTCSEKNIWKMLKQKFDFKNIEIYVDKCISEISVVVALFKMLTLQCQLRIASRKSCKNTIN